MRFLSTIAVAALAALAPTVKAQGQSYMANATQITNDAYVLLYALALEKFEATFYNYYVGSLLQGTAGLYNVSDFVASGIPAYLFPFVQTITDNENAHVEALTNTLLSSTYAGVFPNGTAYVEAAVNCTYDGMYYPGQMYGGMTDPVYQSFNASDLGTFLYMAASIEPVGVGAYNGAAFAISEPGIEAVALSIHSVEARHASLMSYIYGLYSVNSNQSSSYVSPVAVQQSATTQGTQAPGTGPGYVVTDSTAEYTVGGAVQLVPSLKYSFPQVFGVPLTFAEVAALVGSTGANFICSEALGNLTMWVERTSPPANYAGSNATLDDVVLNYAYVLESLEYNFYNYFVGSNGVYNMSDFMYYFGANGQAYYSYFQLILAHETAHAAALAGYATAGPFTTTAFTPSSYNFSMVANFSDFLATAQTLENVGVVAYNGAGANITTPSTQEFAGSIVSVEARHAAFLNILTNATSTYFGGPLPSAGSPFVGAFDTGVEDSALVVAAASPFFATPSPAPTKVGSAAVASFGVAAVSSVAALLLALF